MSGRTTVRSDRTAVERTRGGDELEPGRNVGRYVTLGVVGRGATGVVHRAYDPELDRKVALKLYPPAQGRGADRGAVLHEARALARLRHPHVVTVFDVGEHDGRVFVAMELVDGHDLRAWLDEKRPALPEVLRVLAEAGQGLAAAHAVGIVHRDFKPRNVLVGSDGSAFVADFGLAQHVGPHRHAAGLLDVEDEPTTLPAGTPAYLAPELYDGERADVKSDVFAFSVTAWEAIFGALPWSIEDEFALRDGKRGGPPPLPGTPRIDAALAAALRAGLAASPSERLPDLQPLLHALDPPPARRRWPALAVATAGAAVLAWAVLRSAPCDAGADRTASVWSGARRDAVTDAIASSGIAHAQATAEHVAADLDRFAERWQAEHRDACEATHVRREQSERLLDLRMACLDRRLAQLDTLIELLGSSDVAREGPKAIAKLEAELACAAADVEAEPPTTPEVAAIERDLDRVEVLEAVAQYDDALALARAAETAAAQQQARSVELWASYRVGRLLDIGGDPQAAAKRLAEVHWAAEAAGLDPLAAKAGVYVVYEHAAVFKDPDTALAWAPHVEAAIERAGDDPLDRAALVENVGVAHLYRPDPEAALRSFEESLRLREEAPGQHALAIVSSLGNLGVLYEETHRYDEAIEQHERALALLREYVGEHHPHTARVIDNLGTALLRRGDVAAAVEHFGRALEIRRTVLGARHRSVGLSAVHFGLAALQHGDPDAAIEHYGTALDIYADVFEEDTIDVLQAHEGLAHAWAAKQDWPRARTHAQKALDGLAKVLPADHPELAGLRGILEHR